MRVTTKPVDTEIDWKTWDQVRETPGLYEIKCFPDQYVQVIAANLNVHLINYTNYKNSAVRHLNTSPSHSEDRFRRISGRVTFVYE